MDLTAKLYLMFLSNSWAGELFRQQKNTNMKDFKYLTFLVLHTFIKETSSGG